MKGSVVSIVVVAALMLTSLCFSPLATAGTAQFQFGLAHSDSVTSNHHRLATKFAELANKYSDGRIMITVYPGGQMGNLKTVVEGLQIGTHDLVRTLDVIAALLPESDVFNLPYLFPDRKRFEWAIADPIVEKMLDKFKAKGIVIVSWWENGFRHMTNSVRPIRKPEDLRGLKMRTPPNPARIEMFRLFGGNPAPLPYEELYSALQQKVFDGQENPLNNTRTSKLHEVQKYLSLTSHVYNPQWLAMSRIKWDGLPEWGKAAIKKAGDEVGRMYRAEGEALDEEDLVFLKRYLEVNEVDFAAFRKASQPLYDKFRDKELLNRLLEIAK
jgi:tripartite ATP-independent transporter DctP family solute receptor